MKQLPPWEAPLRSILLKLARLYTTLHTAANAAQQKEAMKKVSKPAAKKVVRVIPHRPDSVRSIAYDLVLRSQGIKALHGAKFVGDVPRTKDRNTLVAFLSKQPAVKREALAPTTALSLAVYRAKADGHKVELVRGPRAKLNKPRVVKAKAPAKAKPRAVKPAAKAPAGLRAKKLKKVRKDSAEAMLG